jgi:hypothetical protein
LIHFRAANSAVAGAFKGIAGFCRHWSSMPQPGRWRTLTGRQPGATILRMGWTREPWGRGRNTRVITAAVIALVIVAVILLASF